MKAHLGFGEKNLQYSKLNMFNYKTNDDVTSGGDQ